MIDDVSDDEGYNNREPDVASMDIREQLTYSATRSGRAYKYDDNRRGLASIAARSDQSAKDDQRSSARRNPWTSSMATSDDRDERMRMLEKRREYAGLSTNMKESFVDEESQLSLTTTTEAEGAISREESLAHLHRIQLYGKLVLMYAYIAFCLDLTFTMLTIA